MAELQITTRERRSKILHLLNKEMKVIVAELSNNFSVSEVTIRKDLEELEKKKLLVRVRGGAIRLPEISNEYDINIQNKQLQNFEEKRAIGKIAATLINENETILIDSGTTTLELAKNLDQFNRLTILTNAVNIAVELVKYKRFNVILLGGYLRDTSLSTVGSIAEAALKTFYCDKLFLGVDSFSLDKGLSTTNIEEANINQAMISMAKITIALFDSSKFNKRNFAFISPVNKIDTIVTDSKIPDELKTQIKAFSIKLHIAKV